MRLSVRRQLNRADLEAIPRSQECSVRLLHLPLDAAERRDAIVEDVTVDDSDPRLALWQVIVELRSNLTHLGQVRPSNVGEVVVLVVVAHVVREHVQWTIVRVSLCDTLHDVVLSQEVPGSWVNGARKESAEEEVEEHLWSKEVSHQAVECQLDGPIQCKPASEWDKVGFCQAWPQSICKDLAEHEDCLAERVVNIAERAVCDKLPLQKGWDICVPMDIPLVPMVVHVVRLKCDAIRDADWQVRDHGDELILCWRLRAQVVR
mmetsp:Transcript_69452/g.175065  ORF Transcript_69452/g.175065 Transcript_69452/m.175065 type:complete len:262 (-) Transcript_69452:381-1166(-)